MRTCACLPTKLVNGLLSSAVNWMPVLKTAGRDHVCIDASAKQLGAAAWHAWQACKAPAGLHSGSSLVRHKMTPVESRLHVLAGTCTCPDYNDIIFHMQSPKLYETYCRLAIDCIPYASLPAS